MERVINMQAEIVGVLLSVKGHGLLYLNVHPTQSGPPSPETTDHFKLTTWPVEVARLLGKEITANPRTVSLVGGHLIANRVGPLEIEFVEEPAFLIALANYKPVSKKKSIQPLR